MIDWYVEGIEFGNCNCDYGCPCQFEAPPTTGNCEGFEVVRIDKGHFGDTRLDGLHVALVYHWPGLVSEGKGHFQAIVDARADEAQRAALVTVLHGGETEEAKTHWWVYHAMSDTVYEPLFKPIELEMDLEARTARCVIPGVLESEGRPIRGVTGKEHRVRIEIEGGIEFERAEIGDAWTRARGEISLDLENSYAQFNLIRHSGTGVVSQFAASA